MRGNDIYSIAGSCVMGREKVHHIGNRYTGEADEAKKARGDIANKGDIVCDADDSQAAEEPISACDTSSLKPSPALSSSDLFRSPPPHLFLPSSFNRRCDTALFFPLRSPTDWSGYLSQSFFSPSSYRCQGAFLSPSFISLQSTGKPNTRLSSDLVSKCTSIHTHKKHTLSPRLSPLRGHTHTHTHGR